MEPARCPHCGGSVVVPGFIVSSDGGASAVRFVPRGSRYLRVSLGVNLHQSLLACLTCGYLWSQLTPTELASFIAVEGGELLRQHLETLKSGPYHGLPDVPAARRAGEGVAAIDALMLDEKQPEATRRYRELTKTTWDHAIDAVRKWRDLKRAEKLALFGWHPKEESRDHPMRDHLLDG